MNCKNLTRAVELQYKFVEFSKTFFLGVWDWTTLTYFKDLDILITVVNI